MKKILLTLVVLASIAFVSKVGAQSCNLAQPVISNISTANGSGGCTITFDLAFDYSANNGNKWKCIYVWTEADYNALPSNFYGSNNNTAPSSAALNSSNALATITINSQQSSTVTTATYPADNTNPLSFKPSLTYSSSGNTITIHGISVSVANCGVQVSLKADVGSANSNSLNTFGCVGHGLPFVANEPIMNGLIGCGEPRYFQFSAKTTTNTTITFSAYSDADHTTPLSAPAGFVYNGYGVSSPTPITTYSNIVLNSTANTSTSFGQFPFQSALGSKFDIYIVVQEGSLPNTNSLRITNTCTALPIGLKSFTAARNHSNVTLNWVTSFEQNSSGFQIQRQMGSGAWQTIAFVPTQSQNGSSKFDLAYSFVDINNIKGISNYRLVLVDIDGNSKYSDIRSVRGEGQLGKMIVYPNPSFDGKVRVVFEDANSMRDVSVTDISGRLVKQMKGITNNNLEIDNLTPGVYTMRVVVRETGEQSVEKIIVNNR